MRKKCRTVSRAISFNSEGVRQFSNRRELFQSSNARRATIKPQGINPGLKFANASRVRANDSLCKVPSEP